MDLKLWVGDAPNFRSSSVRHFPSEPVKLRRPIMQILAHPFLLLFLLASPMQDNAAHELVGDWRGDSICVVRESACHDEDSLYHVSAMPEKAGWFLMKGDKIVD